MDAVGVEQQDRGQHFPLGQLFDRSAQEREDVGERFALDDLLQNALLADEQRFVLLALADVTGQGHQESSAPFPEGPAADFDRK